MTDIAEIYARDPLKHTDKDIDAIIEYTRKAAANFEAGALKRPKAKQLKEDTAALADKLSLEDLLGD